MRVAAGDRLLPTRDAAIAMVPGALGWWRGVATGVLGNDRSMGPVHKLRGECDLHSPDMEVERVSDWFRHNIYLPLYRVWTYKISYIPYRIRCFFQRGWRGYSDDDILSFDSYLAEMIPKALRDMAKKNHGCSPEIAIPCQGEDCEECKVHYNVPDCPMCNEWIKILNDIANGFDSFRKYLGFELTEEEEAEHPELSLIEKNELYLKEWEKGAALFIKYFGHFWD